MPTNTLTARGTGLATSPGSSGSSAKDGLSRADNIVCSSPDVWEVRRGLARFGSTVADKVLDYLSEAFGRLVLHHEDGSTYLWDVDTAASSAAYIGSFGAPVDGGRFRTFEAARSLFLSGKDGISRLDKVDGTVEPAGMVGGLDVKAAIRTTNGTAQAGGSQVAYRVVFGKRDSNGRLILGSPSGRGVSKSATITALAGQANHAAGSNIVTVTLTVPHGLVTGEYIKLTQTDATGFFDLTQASAQVTVSSSLIFTYVDATGGHSGLNTGTLLYQRTTRDVSVATAIPANLPAGSFIQYYRSLSSVSDLADASDELYLAFEAPVPQAAQVATLARTGTTVTATTSAAHNLWAGMEVYLQGLANAPGILAAVGEAVGASSPDGAVWTSRTGRGRSIGWNGSTFSAVGSLVKYSTDGITWNAGSGSPGNLKSVAYGNGRFVAVGYVDPGSWYGSNPAATGEYVTSTDGQTYAAVAGQARIPNVSEATSIVFQNGRFIAVGWDVANNRFRSAVSGDGLNWGAGSPQDCQRLGWANGTELFVGPAPVVLSGSTPVINTAQGWTNLNPTFRDFGTPNNLGLGPPQTDPVSGIAGYVRLCGAVPWGIGGGKIAHSQASCFLAEGWHVASFYSSWWETNPANSTTLRVTVHNAAALPNLGAPLKQQDFTVTQGGRTQVAISFYVPAGGTSAGFYISVENIGQSTAWYDWTKEIAVGEFSVMAQGHFNDPWFVTANENVIVAVSALAGTIFTSTNGLDWTRQQGAGTAPVLTLIKAGTGGVFSFIPWSAWKPLTSLSWLPGKRLFIATGGWGAVTSPDGVTWTNVAALQTLDVRGAAEQGNTVIVVGANVCRTSTDMSAWTAQTIPAGAYSAVVGNPASSIPAGLYTLTGPASGTLGTTSFTFETAASGAIGSTAAVQTAVPVSAGIVDTLPDASLGASLYTNQSQGGILSQHEPPPMAFDVAVYKDHAFYGGIQSPPALSVALLRCGAAGCKVGDLIALPGGNISAQAAENISLGQFAVVADDPYSTVQSICRVINRSPLSGGIRAIQTVAPGSPTPGAFLVVATKPTGTVSFVVSSGDYTAWSTGADGKSGRTVDPAREKNVVAFSLPGLPDAVPLLNRISVGSPDASILRLLPLRESLLVLKEDGIWRITGSSSYDFALEPVDLTAHLVSSESAVVLSNECWALTTAGVVRVSDYGTQVASNDIADQIADLLASDMLATSAALCVAVAYESDSTFTLWGPRLNSDTRPTKGWTFNTVTNKWTGRTDGYRHVLRRKHDDKLWAVQGANLYRERKNFNRTDCADDSRATVTVTSVGATTKSIVVSSAAGLAAGDVIVQGSSWATILTVDYTQNLLVLDSVAGFAAGLDAEVLASIPVAIEWNPSYGEAGPGVAFQAREAGLVFADAQYTKANVAFRSDIASAEATVPLDYADLAIIKETAVPQPRTVRVLVTPEHQRGSRLTVRFEHANAWRPFRLEALSLLYRTVGKMSR